MRTEVRFLLAIGLMLLVLVGTNILFPPVVPDPPAPQVEAPGGGPPAGPPGETLPGLPGAPADSVAGALPGGEPGVAGALPGEPAPERTVEVVSPLYRYTFSTRGAALRSVELERFRSLRTDGPVELIPPDGTALEYRVVGPSGDTLDLGGVPFEVTPEDGLTLAEGSGPAAIAFTFRHPSGAFDFEIEYTFSPDSYVVDAVGRVRGVERPLVLTRLGKGLGINESDSTAEARMMAYAGNHLNDGIRSVLLSDVDGEAFEEGPFLWAAFRSKFFVTALMPRGVVGPDGAATGGYLGAILVRPEPEADMASVAVAQEVRSDGTFAYQLLMGPQDYAELVALGNDLEEVNPYGWRFFRPIVRPFVSIITTVLIFLHNSLGWGYGWVLMVFGLMMRVLLWPLNQKAMRAQMRNMAVQPMVKEIQTKYKDQPEKMQKEMLRLYKEYGFNPMAGCLPMLLPWPILIALFFVFQNTIEFRGVPFLWMPDLSAPDPLYILPVFLAISMFLLQFISYRAMEQDNPQMKMMMYFFPIFFGFLFMKFAAGLNLYYSVMNIATLPQQYWIAKERKKVQARGPVKLEDRKK